MNWVSERQGRLDLQQAAVCGLNKADGVLQGIKHAALRELGVVAQLNRKCRREALSDEGCELEVDRSNGACGCIRAAQ